MCLLVKYVRECILICEGYLKWLFDVVTRKKSKRAEARYKICLDCDNYCKGICSVCGCVLKAKVRVDFDLDDEGISIDGCPERKW